LEGPTILTIESDELESLRSLARKLDDVPESLARVLDWLEEQPISMDRSTIVHRDFHGNNVLIRKDGSPCVIDWSNCTLGDARIDLAWIRLLTAPVLRAGQVNDDLRLYEKLTARKIDRLEYFEVVCCTKLLLSTLVTLRHGPERLGLRPEAKSMQKDGASFAKYAASIIESKAGISTRDLEELLIY
jgi:Ser/Thr protein kinase RdoA (MazF antagonist)